MIPLRSKVLALIVIGYDAMVSFCMSVMYLSTPDDRARISAIENELDDPVLMTLKEQLTEASEHEAGTDQTKVYLEIAKIED